MPDEARALDAAAVMASKVEAYVQNRTTGH